MRVGEEILRRIEQNRPRFILLQFGAVDLHVTYLWFVALASPALQLLISDYSRTLSLPGS